jgi:hypothetical protein
MTVPYSEASSAFAPEGIRQTSATSANTSIDSFDTSREEEEGEERREDDILRKERRERESGGVWWMRESSGRRAWKRERRGS